MIGILPAAFGIKNGEAIGIGQIIGLGGGACGVKRRMLHQPDAFIRDTFMDVSHTGFHPCLGLAKVGQACAGNPFYHYTAAASAAVRVSISV